MADRAVGADGIAMKGGGYYSLATVGAKHVIDGARCLAAELRGISASTLELTNSLNQTLSRMQPDLEATLASARSASDKLPRDDTISA